ncbi:hypothetical protein [Pseudomonas sp. 31 E 5]|nr:hypothetical protein [Pseudomonas sp. 31 E 5]
MVDTPGVFDHPISAVTRQIAGAVQPLTGHERAGDKTFGGQAWALVVTPRQADARQVQLAGHARRQRLQAAVEDICGQVGNRLADRHAVTAFVHAGPVGHVDGRFGRAVQVVQPRVRQLGEDLLLDIHRQRFTAAHDALEAGAAADGVVLQKRLQHRRHKVQGADLFAVDQLDQLGRVTVITRRRHDQARAGHQRPEELPHRHVEAERGFLHHRVAGVQAVGALHPAQAVGQRYVAVARALGLAGGARGVDHVGEVFAGQGDTWVDGAVSRQPVARLIQRHAADRHRDRQALQQRLLGQQQLNAAVFEHVAQAILRVVRVQRHVGAAGLEDGHQRHNHFNGALGRHAHQHVRANALRDQVMRQSVGTLVELAIAQALFTERQRRRVRGVPHLGFDQLLHGVLQWEVGGGGVPAVEQGAAFAGGQHRQRFNRLFWRGQHRVEQCEPMAGHALDGRGVEQVRGIGKACRNPSAVLNGIERQVKLRRVTFPLQPLHLQIGQLHGRSLPVFGLVVEHDLEQRVTAQATLGLQHLNQLLKRQVLMRLRIQCGFAHLLQQTANTGAAIHFSAQHLGIDQKADQPLGFTATAVGDRHTDADIRLATVAVQQQLERGKQYHERGDVLTLAQTLERFQALSAQLNVDRGAGKALHRWARMVGGQLKYRLLAGQLGLPVAQLTLALPRLHPMPLPQCIVGILYRQRRQLCRVPLAEGCVQLHQLIDHDLQGSTVTDAVVQGQNQHMLVLGKPKQTSPNQRPRCQIERLGDLGFYHGLQAGLTFGRPSGFMGLGHQRCAACRGNALQHTVCALDKRGAQAFMASHQSRQAVIQGVKIQATRQAQRLGQVVGRAVRFQLPQEPLALLGV